MAVLREQSELFGRAASRPTAWRTVQAVASVEQRAIVRAVAAARAKVWTAAGLNVGEVTLDFDATLIDAYSEKQDAAPTYKRGFGFQCCDRGTRERTTRTIISSSSTRRSTAFLSGIGQGT